MGICDRGHAGDSNDGLRAVTHRPVPTLTAPEFALIYQSRARQLGWFLGAGTSAAAGIPTGYDKPVDNDLSDHAHRVTRRDLLLADVPCRDTTLSGYRAGKPLRELRVGASTSRFELRKAGTELPPKGRERR